MSKNGDGMSTLEWEFMTLWHQLAPNAPEPEHDVKKLIPNRQFRCDFVWREPRVVVELQGSVYAGKNGGHTSGKGYEDDADKSNLLMALGWRVFRFTRGLLRRDPIGCINLVRAAVDPLPVLYAETRTVRKAA